MKKIILLAISLFLLMAPSANAVDISWTTEEYIAHSSVTGSSDTQYGPNVSVEVGNNYADPYATALSFISDTIIDVIAQSKVADSPALAEASFSGTYLASANAPLFQFSYWLSSAEPYGEYIYASLLIRDETDNSILYSNDVLPQSINTSVINVLTNADHLISVNYGLIAYTDGSVTTGWNRLVSEFGTTVVPEPISSTLFLIGGAVLGFRRFRKRVSG